MTREPPTAARIAEIRRQFAIDAAEYAEVGATEDDLTIDHTAIRDLLAALALCRETLDIALIDLTYWPRLEVQERYDRLFREGPQ